MKQKVLLFLLVLLSVLTASADDVKIGNVYYELNASIREAKVKHGFYNYWGDVTIPDSVTYENTTYSVTSIDNDAFFFCKSLISVTIGNCVREIEHEAFYGCSHLKSVAIGNSVKKIGACAFEDCKNLTSVRIPPQCDRNRRQGFL